MRQLFNSMLVGACLTGHKEIVLSMIENGANDWNDGLIKACYGGYKDLALLIIEKGANAWKWGLTNACSGGHKDLALLMIEKGANINDCSIELGEEDIEILIKIGIKNFGKYKKTIYRCKEKINRTKLILEPHLIEDVINICCKY